MDLGQAPWNALSTAQRTVALYTFTTSQPRLLITNAPTAATARVTRHGAVPSPPAGRPGSLEQPSGRTSTSSVPFSRVASGPLSGAPSSPCGPTAASRMLDTASTTARSSMQATPHDLLATGSQRASLGSHPDTSPLLAFGGAPMHGADDLADVVRKSRAALGAAGPPPSLTGTRVPAGAGCGQAVPADSNAAWPPAPVLDRSCSMPHARQQLGQMGSGVRLSSDEPPQRSTGMSARMGSRRLSNLGQGSRPAYQPSPPATGALGPASRR